MKLVIGKKKRLTADRVAALVKNWLLSLQTSSSADLQPEGYVIPSVYQDCVNERTLSRRSSLNWLGGAPRDNISYII